MRIFILILLGLLLQCNAQTFSSHTVVLTPSQRPEISFDEEEYRGNLLKKYGEKFKKQARLNEFVNMMAVERRNLHYSNYVYTNWPEATDYLEEMLEIALPEATTDQKIKLYLVREPSVNASMMDDGSLYLNIGLLAEINSEAELMAVIGHEYGHFAAQHSFKTYNEVINVRNQNQFLSAVFMGSLLQLANIKRLYGDIQGMEKEADDNGVRLFKRLELAPEAMSTVYRRFEAMEKKYKSRADYKRRLIYFSTHPDPLKRLDNCAAQFNYEQNQSRKHFLLDSARFMKLRKRAIDECIYLFFEGKDYAECIELAYREHLFAPDDEFYTFFLTECLRREISLNPPFANSLFVTGQYKLAPPPALGPPDYIESKFPEKEKKVFQSVFYQLQGAVYNMSYDQVREIKADQLLSTDTIEFLTNAEALGYFTGKLRPQCGAHQFTLRCLDKKVDVERTPAFITDFERRYATQFPDMAALETPYDKMFIFLGNVTVSDKKENYSSTLGINRDDGIRQQYVEYFTTVAAFNDQLSFQPKVNFDDKYIIFGSLMKIRELNYVNGKYSPPAKQLYSDLDPELYFITHKYHGNRFALVEISVVNGSNKQWIYDIYTVDFPANRILKRTVKRKVGMSRKEKELFSDILADFKAWVAAQPKTS